MQVSASEAAPSALDAYAAPYRSSLAKAATVRQLLRPPHRSR